LEDLANIYYEHLNFLKLKSVHCLNVSRISEEEEISNFDSNISKTSKSNKSLSDNKNKLQDEISINSNSSSSSSSLESNESKIMELKNETILPKNSNKNIFSNKKKFQNNHNQSSLSQKENKNLKKSFSTVIKKKDSLSFVKIPPKRFSNFNWSKTNKFHSIDKKNTYKSYFDYKSKNSNLNKNQINQFSNYSNLNEIQVGDSERTFADIISIPKITVKKKKGEKKELQEEIIKLRSDNSDINNINNYRESKVYRKISITTGLKILDENKGKFNTSNSIDIDQENNYNESIIRGNSLIDNSEKENSNRDMNISSTLKNQILKNQNDSINYYMNSDDYTKENNLKIKQSKSNLLLIRNIIFI